MSTASVTFSGFDRPLGRRLLRLTPAVAISIGLHCGALIVAGRASLMRQSYVTILDPRAAMPDDRDETRDDEDLNEPDTVLLNPGIEDGSKQARVTWIGYSEYEEHLAALADVDQAAFASAEPQGGGGAAGAPDMVQTPLESETVEIAEAEPTTNPQETVIPVPNRIVPPELRLVAPLLEMQPLDRPELAVNARQATVLDEPVDPLAAEENQTAGDPSPVENAATEAVTATPAVEPSDIVGPGRPAETDGANTDGDPTADPQAERSEKDTTATSIHDVPESAWMSGKPLAMAGLEIQPYSLYKHILVDSGDRMLTMHWASSIKHNAVVSLRFDSRGVAGEVNVLRETGYQSFDRLYLRNWLARWTATGEELKQLKPDQLCEPIIFKLIFVREPEARKEARAEDTGSR